VPETLTSKVIPELPSTLSFPLLDVAGISATASLLGLQKGMGSETLIPRFLR